MAEAVKLPETSLKSFSKARSVAGPSAAAGLGGRRAHAILSGIGEFSNFFRGKLRLFTFSYEISGWKS